MKKRPDFWNKEYRSGKHIALSNNPSEDLVKFTRWLIRQSGREFLNPAGSVLDLGCGNGRNLIYLAREFGMTGNGVDISAEAIRQAKANSRGLSIGYEVRSIAEPLPFPDQSQTLVLDMMTSHFLDAEKRTILIKEIARVLKPGGWLFWKTFLTDRDRHAAKLLAKHPAAETGSYIHPESGLVEHVASEEETRAALEPSFAIHKITKSHRLDKRRSMSIYAQKT